VQAVLTWLGIALGTFVSFVGVCIPIFWLIRALGGHFAVKNWKLLMIIHRLQKKCRLAADNKVLKILHFSNPIAALSQLAPHVFLARLGTFFVVFLLEPGLLELITRSWLKPEKESWAMWVGQFLAMFFIVFLHEVFWLKPTPMLLLTWPGYEKDEEIIEPMRASGVQLQILSSQADGVVTVFEKLSGTKTHQVHALVVDQEGATEVNNICGQVKALKSVEMPKEFCKCVQNLPAEFQPVRFGFNGICWENARCLTSGNTEEITALVNSSELTGCEWKRRYESLLEASAKRPLKLVGFYEWWPLQMLLHFKIVLASHPENLGISDAIKNARFDLAGQPANDLVGPWDKICAEVIGLLEKLKAGGKGFEDMKEMFEALVESPQPPHLLVGPGDSFVKGNRSLGKEINWDFVGPRGGLMWVEGLTFPKRRGGQDSANSLTEEEKRLANLLASDRAQLAICNSEADFNFYANSPFKFGDWIETKHPMRYGDQEVNPQLAKLAKASGTDTTTMGCWDLLKWCLDSGRLILRPSPNTLATLHWDKAYNKVIKPKS